MEKDITIDIHVEEDETNTTAKAVLNLRGGHLEAEGSARRSPIDPPKPEIGEELAIARALGVLQAEVVEDTQDKINRYLGAE